MYAIRSYYAIIPLKKVTTDSGNDTSFSGFKTSSLVRPLVIMDRAMSPTTLELGVTFTISPNMSFTSL